MPAILNIPEALPSLNKTLRSHWAKQHRLRDRWKWLVRAARLDARIFAPIKLQKARVTIERWGSQRLDYDNLVGGAAKFAIDSLKNEGFIVDDSPEHVLVDYIQHIGEPHTRITIRAV